jgi:hypothetical protein
MSECVVTINCVLCEASIINSAIVGKISGCKPVSVLRYKSAAAVRMTENRQQTQITQSPSESASREIGFSNPSHE